jgi:hypothetical protein
MSSKAGVSLWRNRRFAARAKSALVLALFAAGQSQYVFAAAIVGTGGEIAAARQMAVDKNADPANPFSYAILRNIAKALTKNGFPASFFLGLDSRSGPGIDLRTILLYEAGVLKSPVKLFMPQRSKKKSDTPTLSIGAFPEGSGQMPSAAPKLDNPDILDAQKDGDNKSDAAAAADARRRAKEAVEANSALSIDLNHFDSQPAPLNTKKHKKHKDSDVPKGGLGAIAGDLETLAMMRPLSIESPRAVNTEENAFRFWTVPQALNLSDRFVVSDAPFSGSFVMMSPQGLKGIEGRSFTMKAGHALVSNAGRAITLETPAAKVSVEAGATVFVELDKNNVCRIRVLEAKNPGHDVSVEYTSTDGKNNDLQLAAGDDLLVADHTLSDSDKANLTKPATVGGADNSVKASFSPKELVNSDTFFSTDGTQQNPDQRAAMTQLRERLK